MNIVKSIINAYSSRSQRKRLRLLAQVVTSYKRLVDCGLLSWNPRERILYIDQTIAALYISMGPRRFTTFLDNINFAHIYLQQSEQWNAAFQEKIHTRIDDFRKNNPTNHSAADIERVRQLAIRDIHLDDLTVPSPDPFSFYIVYSDHINDPKVTFVGDYNPLTSHLDMAPWEDIRTAFADRIQKQNPE